MYNLNYSMVKKQIIKLLEEYEINCLSTFGNMALSELNNYKYEMLDENINCKYDYIYFSTEEVIKKIKYINYIRYSFNKLTTQERKLIYWSYIDKEHSYDDRFIANQLGYSLGYFYIQKKDALIRFAFALGLK